MSLRRLQPAERRNSQEEQDTDTVSAPWGSKSDWLKRKVLTGLTAVSLAAGVPKPIHASGHIDDEVPIVVASLSVRDSEVKKQMPESPGRTVVVVAVAGAVGASGVVLMRAAGSEGNSSVALGVLQAAVPPQAENATTLLKDMQPLLSAWEQALVAVDEAEVALERADPAKSESALTSLWYTIDPLKTREKTVQPLEEALNASMAARDMAALGLTRFLAAIKSDDIKNECQAEKTKVDRKVAARKKARMEAEAARRAAEAAREAADKARREKERAEQREKERAEAAVRKAEAERLRMEEEIGSQKAAEDRVRRALLADLDRKAQELIKDRQQSGAPTLKLDALLAAKKEGAQAPPPPPPPVLEQAAQAPPRSRSAPPQKPAAPERVAVDFDPLGEGSKLLSTLGISAGKAAARAADEASRLAKRKNAASGGGGGGGELSAPAEARMDALTRGSKYLSAFSMPWSSKPAEGDEPDAPVPQISRRLGSFRAAGKAGAPGAAGPSARGAPKERPGTTRKPPPRP
jgi:hypothetical protein